MDLMFDISQDEMPIFMAETEDHLQTLDEILVRLEQEDNNEELIQSVFRAAHTLKGMAGMIGHKRMVTLTHALETALDGLRKGNLQVTTALIDICLEAVDGLRLLQEEVVENRSSDVDVETLAENFTTLIQASQADNLSYHLAQKTGQANNGKPQKDSNLANVSEKSNGKHAVKIEAQIAADSIASAARAFQIMMVLQSFGEIQNMTPSQEVIESAAKVATFSADLFTNSPVNEIQEQLNLISEVEKIVLTDDTSSAVNVAEKSSNQTEDGYQEPTQLGEYLVKEGLVSEDYLQQALRVQETPEGEKKLVGQLLVQLGAISQEDLDAAVVALIKKQKQAVAAATRKPRADHRAEMMVRTSVERLDTLMNLVGELITDRNHLFQVRNHLENDLHTNDHISKLSETVAHIGRITDQLQEEVMHIRMLPIGNVFNKFPRLVRDLSQSLGKQIDLIVEGEDTELDRSVIDEINDPLIHLIRNSVDHGIETPEERKKVGKSSRGTIWLTARHEQGRIIITVEDDGKGINAQSIRESAVSKGLISQSEAAALSDDKTIDLIFLSGLSTSKKTTDISGRGVGMDIVRANIQRVNGTILVDSKPGQGTQFQIVLPLTLAIVPTLLVRVGETPFAIPLVMVAETLRLEQKEIKTVRGQPVTQLRDQVLPLLYMKDAFKVKTHGKEGHYHYVVVVHSGKSRVGLIVDRLMGEEEVVVKSLSSIIGDIPGISSAAILGDGRVSLIVDVIGLFKLSGIH